MKLIVCLVLFLMILTMTSAYYLNPYLGNSESSSTVDRSLGTQGGFTRVLANRNGLTNQINQKYTRKSIQSYTPYSANELATIRKSVNQNQYFLVQNEVNAYRTPISYADETLKEKLTKALGIRVVFDPAVGKNVLIRTIPTQKLVELLNNPRSRVETFRGNDINVDAVMQSLGLGKGAFVPKSRDDNLKY
ncbi:MAG: hypothetical protein AABX70_08095 [Nanoarchaeota archaeon]